MDCTIRKGLTGLLAGSMLFLSGFARAGEAADENRGYPATQDATEIPAVQAGGNSAASGFDTSSETDGNTRTDSTAAFPRRRFVHGIGLELRPEYVCPTNPFLAGDNLARQPIDLSLAAHLRYSFRFQPGSRPDRIYGGAYQGVGFSYYSFENREELGTPVAFYIFQGARIARISRRLSFNYEWNFGLSFGWKPYDEYDNPENQIIGSKVNAYLNVNLYLKWALSPKFDLMIGATGSHFSNGNTQYPNSGLNTVDCKVGLVYNFNRRADELAQSWQRPIVPPFPRHVSYDLTLFGSWRKKAVAHEGSSGQVPAPGTYNVFGFSFAPMYNFGYKFRAGVALDGVYDHSANMKESYEEENGFYTPPAKKQMALGLSARGEFVMPYFTVGIGLGANVLHGGGDMKSFYQILALKIDVTRNSYLHIGYNLREFHEPNYLMLGIGYRFNNKRPKLF